MDLKSSPVLHICCCFVTVQFHYATEAEQTKFTVHSFFYGAALHVCPSLDDEDE